MKDINSLVDAYANKTNTDVLAYLGDIESGYDDFIIDSCRNRKLRKNVLLMLTTSGGDPNAAYRIVRCLQEAYNTYKHDDIYKKKSLSEKNEQHGDFIVLIDNYCKSAGTLICLGADKIIMSGNGQLGPIDVQMRKHEEVGERTSGLTPIQAMQFLETQSTYIAFKVACCSMM